MFDTSSVDAHNSSQPSTRQDATPDLAAIPAGPDLGAALARLDTTRLTPYERVDVWQARQRQIAHMQAMAYLDMVAVEQYFLDGGDDEQTAFEGTSSEFAAAGALTRRAAESETAFAQSIWTRLPRVGAALLAGAIDVRRARALVQGTEHLSEETAQAIVGELIDQAGEWTTSQLSARIRRRCIEHDPDEAQSRYEQAVEDRRAMTTPTADGTANFHVYDAPPHEVLAAARHVDWLAKELKRAGDKRPIDQIRADVALDLLQGKPHAGKARVLGGVHIHASLESLARLADDPGELAGYGPVVADITRQVVELQTDTKWTYIITDPTTGEITTGTTGRRPTTSQQRQVRARYQTCTFPGCRMPAHDCDLDHRNEYHKTRRTCASDLYPHCRHHHRIRHEQGWTYRPLGGGRIEYTTRLGHKHTTDTRGPPLGN